MKVFVTGAEGFVGRILVERLRARGDAVIASDRRDLDVSDAARVRAALAEARPDAVAHLAAITFVPKRHGEFEQIDIVAGENIFSHRPGFHSHRRYRWRPRQARRRTN